jgi:hypothetical protein
VAAPHGRNRERADGVEADAGSERGGAPVSLGTPPKRLRVSVLGRGEPAGAVACGIKLAEALAGLRSQD